MDLTVQKKWNDFIQKQKQSFEDTHHLMESTNHSEHNSNPDYWDVLLGDITQDPEFWSGKVAFDFGCGCGRNISNLLKIAKFLRVDGCDISKQNADFAQSFVRTTYGDTKCNAWENDGFSLSRPSNEKYDFIMSTIVLQHIPNYDVRFSILFDMVDALNDGGILSIQLADMEVSVPYYTRTDQLMNCRVEDPLFVQTDLHSLGLKNIQVLVKKDPFNPTLNWYYAKGVK